MKMPRSQCESENVQFVQELAEVDGPFESPININFRDLTKLELPSLVWNRGETCPKKMKITNTGHTVIISGKWKCERPYLTGGPLSGKYVFSQIHFHWGQDDCKGSEHLVCGDGYPLEMHVAHFKTEYLTQESALREKDGMVVVVYLFKIQEEPNNSLKKIINLLPCVQQPSTSHALDPRPILSFCNPFTDDYFMYWGSVVTSTCAHILLWIICREPFGISKDQVNEFRKIMDSCNQPIYKNSREVQPLHKRNVFHVNASKHLDAPLLPIKNILGCFCKESSENVNIQQDCKCQAAWQNQEEVEGSIVECTSGNHCVYTGGTEHLYLEESLHSSCFHHNQTIYVQRATVHPIPGLLKRFGSEPARNRSRPENPRPRKVEEKHQSKPMSKSCCFLPLNGCGNIKREKRKSKGKKTFNSIRAFSQIMHSLEALKNQTFKKLKEIESINQEIKGMKSVCQDNVDKRWLRKIEKLVKRQKRFTIKSSQGCLSELKKLAKDCNLDKIFDCKALPVNENNGKLIWLYNDEITKENLCNRNTGSKQQAPPPKDTTKQLTTGKAIKFSAKAQKLIQSFFEDIQETEELQETVKNDLNLKKIKSYCGQQAGDSHSVSSIIKGYITPNMFASGKLGDRFFTEVSTEDFQNNEKKWENKKTNATEKSLILQEVIKKEEILPNPDYGKIQEKEVDLESNNSKNDIFKPHNRKSVALVLSKSSTEADEPKTLPADVLCDISNEEKQIFNMVVLNDEERTRDRKIEKPKKKCVKISSMLLCDAIKKSYKANKMIQSAEVNYEVSWNTQESNRPGTRRSSSTLSMESIETQTIAKFRRSGSRRDSWDGNSSDQGQKSYTSLYEQNSCRKFQSYFIQKKNHKTKKRKKPKGEGVKYSGSSSREALRVTVSRWKSLTKAKFRVEIAKTSESLVDVAFENSVTSPKRKKIKLQSQKGSARQPRDSIEIYSTDEVDEKSEEQQQLTIENRLEEKEDAVSNENDLKKPINSSKITKESKDVSWTSLNKGLKANSFESKTSFRETEKPNEDLHVQPDKINKILNLEIPKQTKSVTRGRSLPGLPTAPRISTEIARRLYLESLEKRRKNNKQISNLKIQSQWYKHFEERPEIKQNLSSEILTDNYESEEIEQKLERNHLDENQEKEIPHKTEYNTSFFVVSSQKEQELPLKSDVKEIKSKNPVLKRCDADKYQFLEKLTPSFQEHNEEYSQLLHQTDSSKSFGKDASKGDADPQNSTKDLQTSVSYLRLTKNSPSRPHSAETLNSLAKTLKRKGKKRPHCCKRISRHYIRKNSSIFKKPQRTESKQLNFLSLTDQEQLKIISVNVAKYLKQKLIEESNGLDSKNTSINNIEEAVFTKLKAAQEKKEEKSPKEVVVNEQKIKQNRIPALKQRTEKKREKVAKSESKIKIKPVKTPNEPKNEKPVCASPKPANNFIKLNKLMAGKYKKRAIPQPEKKVEAKQKQNPSPEMARKIVTPKFTTRIPKKQVEKNPVQKVQEQIKLKSEIPVSPKSRKQSPTGKGKNESPNKSPNKSPNISPRSPTGAAKTKLKGQKPEKETPPSNNEKETKELVACAKPPTENSPAPVTPQETLSGDKSCVPAFNLASYASAPIEISDSRKKILHRYLLDLGGPGIDCLPDVLYDNKGKKLAEAKEAVFRKELEYFIKLEMLDISANLENSMNYVKSTLSHDRFGSNRIENLPVGDPKYNDSFNKEIVLLKMKDVDSSSSTSDFVAEVDEITSGKYEMHNNKKGTDKIFRVEMPKESGDLGIISPKIMHERQEETNSDSSYDCKISITLNTNFNVESELKQNTIIEEITENAEGESELQGSDADAGQADYLNNHIVESLEASSSQSVVVKNRRKRKENEISLEMKHKLLEILEGEIRREVGMKCGPPSDNSSDGLTFKWEDSDMNEKSYSTLSSCDDIEVLTQISDTMRQYLENLKQKGQLVEIINQTSDMESKKEDASQS